MQCYLIKCKFNAIQIFHTSDLVGKADYNTKTEEIEKKIPSHDKYITTDIGKFSKIICWKIKTSKFKQAKMISQILKKTDFNERRSKINKVTSNEVKDVVEARKKLKWLYNFLHKISK